MEPLVPSEESAFGTLVQTQDSSMQTPTNTCSSHTRRHKPTTACVWPRAITLRGVCLRYPRYHYKTPQQQTPKTPTRNSTPRRGVCLCSHEYLHNTTVGRLQRPKPRTPHSEPRREPAQSAIIGLRTCWSEALHFPSSLFPPWSPPDYHPPGTL